MSNTIVYDLVELERILYNQQIKKMELYQHEIPAINSQHLELTDHRQEFLKMESYLRGLGLDYGSGSNRLSPSVISVDRHKEPGVDLVWDVLTLGS